MEQSQKKNLIDIFSKSKIFLNNKPIHDIPIHLRAKEGLGYLPQQRSVFDMSVYDNVMGIAQISIKNTSVQKSVTEKLLDEFNLQHLRSLKASVLSGGEIRRLMMARIMINKPKIVLFLIANFIKSLCASITSLPKSSSIGIGLSSSIFVLPFVIFLLLSLVTNFLARHHIKVVCQSRR